MRRLKRGVIGDDRPRQHSCKLEANAISVL